MIKWIMRMVSVGTLLVFTSPSHAEWILEEKIDEMTDEVTLEAYALDERGNPQLMMACMADRRVGLSIYLDENTFETGDSYRYRIDKEPVVEVASKYVAPGDMIMFGPLLFKPDDEESKKTAAALHQGMVRGNQIIFEFGTLRHKIDLSGSGPVIRNLSNACGIEIECMGRQYEPENLIRRSYGISLGRSTEYCFIW